jgi:hypothetical protein
MKKNDSDTELRTKILFGLNLVYERLIEFKKLKKSDLVVMKNGKIVRIKPEQA